jgi:phospholipid/cholesterol/gamma-HCH transport system ATP-binding protein
MGAQAKIIVENLNKSFGSKKVLQNLSFSVNKGESLVIIGGSGFGKSVTIKLISSLMQPDSGSIKIDDLEVSGIKGDKKDQLMSKFGFLFQGGALFDSLPIWQNVAFRLLNCDKIDKKTAKERAILALKSVGLNENVAELAPAELSGGMQKRAALARAVITKPEIIFFDEPTTGLDPIMSDVINNLIVDNSKKLGATTITITHDMASARKIADKIAMLYNGKFIWMGDAKDIDNSNNPYVEQFINGSSEGPINLI